MVAGLGGGRRPAVRASSEWRFLGVLAHAGRGLAAAWWGLIVLRGALPAAFTLAMGLLVGELTAGGSLLPGLVLTGAAFVAINALGPVHDAVGADLGERAAGWLHDRLMASCLAPPGIAHLERAELADDLATAREFDRGRGSPNLATAVPQIGAGFATLLSGAAQAGVLAGYHVWAAVLVAGAWAATHVLLRDSAVWRAFASPAVAAERRHVSYAYRLAVDHPAAKEVRVFGLADWLVGRFAARQDRLVQTLFHEMRLRRGPMTGGAALVVLANAAVFFALARDAAGGVLSAARLVVFAQAAVGTGALAFSAVDWWFRGTAQPVPTALDLPRRMAPAGAIASGTRAAAGLPARELRFAGVGFAYDGRPVLRGLDLAVPAGSSLAIVGRNGAGKTTIAKLLCRLYDPTQGAILADGVDLRELSLPSWRARVAVLFQDFVRYELPLRDNVAPGGAPDAAVAAALQAAGGEDLAELDAVLSRGYPGGTDLSGGQWQRVALARALRQVGAGAGLLILDEPTAHLDVRAEAEAFARVLAAARGCTTILISHRFASVRQADRICVIDGGAVAELGTHDQLMAAGGLYRRMFDLQAQGFVDEEDGDGAPG